MLRARIGVIFLGLTLAFLLVLSPTFSEEPLSVTVNLSKDTYDLEEIVTISGEVVDSSSVGVGNAFISIQVEGPNGETIHLAMIVTDGEGNYIDQFPLPSNAVQGSYTVYVTASKPGYTVAENQASYTVIPENMFPIRLLVLTLLLTSILMGAKMKKVFSRISPILLQ